MAILTPEDQAKKDLFEANQFNALRVGDNGQITGAFNSAGQSTGGANTPAWSPGSDNYISPTTPSTPPAAKPATQAAPSTSATTVVGGGNITPGGGILSGSSPANSTSSTSTTSSTTSTPTPQSLGLPATWQISPDQTVEGRINNLTDPNNPLIAQARSRALGQMNGRGLLNSSMAIGAADSAAYDAAMPIATADAANASKVAGYNTDQKNQFAIKNLDDATNRYSIDTNATTSRDNAKLSADTQLKIKQLDQAQQTQLSQLETQNKALMQNSSVASSAYDKYANTLYNNSVNKDMTPQARYQADQNAFNIYQQQISLAAKLMGVPDVSNLLVFTGVDPNAPPPIDPATGKPKVVDADKTTVGGGILNPVDDQSYYQR